MGKNWLHKTIILHKISEKLQQYNIRVSQKVDCLKVTFPNTKITEYWYLGNPPKGKHRAFPIPLAGPFFVNPIPTHREYPLDPFNPILNDQLQKYFIITKKSIRNAGWCDVRLKIHELVAQLNTEGWVDISYPHHILQDDLNSLKAENPSKYQSSHIRFLMYDKRNFPGRKTIYHYTTYLDTSGVRTYWNTKSLYYTINRLMRTPRNITRLGIIRNLITHNCGKQWGMAAPGYYRAIFTKWLDVTGKVVLDIDPDPAKLMAVSMEGGSYSSNSTLLMPLMGVFNIIPADDSPNVVLLSRHIPLDASEAIRRIEEHLQGRLGCILVKQTALREVVQYRKPDQILRINSGVASTANVDNSLIIYRQK